MEQLPRFVAQGSLSNWYVTFANLYMISNKSPRTWFGRCSEVVLQFGILDDGLIIWCFMVRNHWMYLLSGICY